MFYTDGYRPKNSSGILEGDNLVHLKPQLETMIESGFGFISFQQAVKQAFLLSFVSRMQKSLNRRLAILDIGGGYGPLCFYCTDYGSVTNVDFFDKPMWPTDGWLPKGLDAKNFSVDEVLFVKTSFQDFAISTQKKYDVILDSCSLIHFGNYGEQNMEALLGENSKLISSLLLDDTSRFVSVTDVSSDSSWQFRDFLHLANFLSFVCQDSQLQLVSEVDLRRLSKEMPKSYFAWWRNEKYQGRAPLYTLVCENSPSVLLETSSLRNTSPTVFHGFGRRGIVAPVAFAIFQKNTNESKKDSFISPKASLARPLKLYLHLVREFYKFQILDKRLFLNLRKLAEQIRRKAMRS